MAVKKAKDASFKRMDSAYASSKSAIQKVKNADPLNAKEEQEQEEGNASVDPANYLSKKEKRNGKGCLILQSSVISGRQNGS